MANEATATQAAEATTTEAPATETAQATATPPAGASNTEQPPQEQTVPYARFKEVNDKLKAIEQDATKRAKAEADAEQKRLADEGKWKEAFEKQQAELTAAQAAAKAKELELLQLKVANDTKLPAAFAELLKGETLEEMTAHAKTLLAAMPKPVAPDINANSGNGGAPQAGQLSDAEKAALAANLGVNPKFM